MSFIIHSVAFTGGMIKKISTEHVPVAWCSGNAFDPINEVIIRRARLVLRWVTACGQENHLGM